MQYHSRLWLPVVDPTEFVAAAVGDDGTDVSAACYATTDAVHGVTNGVAAAAAAGCALRAWRATRDGVRGVAATVRGTCASVWCDDGNGRRTDAGAVINTAVVCDA